MAARVLSLLVLVIAQASGQEVAPPDADQVALARYLWSGVRENRGKLKRGVYEARGPRVLDDDAHQTHAEGNVEIFGAFDFDAGLWRFDRSEPLALPNEGSPDPLKGVIRDRASGKLIMTPRKNIHWMDMMGSFEAAVVAKPGPSPLLEHCPPFDVRALGLIYWNRDFSALEFDQVLNTWTNERLENASKDHEHIYKITTSTGPNHGVVFTVWLDESKGFTPVRSEVVLRSRRGLIPMYFTELSWAEISGVWVPKAYHNEFHTGRGSFADAYDLAFSWKSVNKPVPEALFTVAGLDLKKGTYVVETRSDKRYVKEIIGGPLKSSRSPEPHQTPRNETTTVRITRRVFIITNIVVLLAVVAFFGARWARKKVRQGSPG